MTNEYRTFNLRKNTGEFVETFELGSRGGVKVGWTKDQAKALVVNRTVAQSIAGHIGRKHRVNALICTA